MLPGLSYQSASVTWRMKAQAINKGFSQSTLPDMLSISILHGSSSASADTKRDTRANRVVFMSDDWVEGERMIINRARMYLPKYRIMREEIER